MAEQVTNGQPADAGTPSGTPTQGAAAPAADAAAQAAKARADAEAAAELVRAEAAAARNEAARWRGEAEKAFAKRDEKGKALADALKQIEDLRSKASARADAATGAGTSPAAGGQAQSQASELDKARADAQAAIDAARTAADEAAEHRVEAVTVAAEWRVAFIAEGGDKDYLDEVAAAGERLHREGKIKVEGGKVSGVAEALKEYREKKPRLFGAARPGAVNTGNAANPGPRAPVTKIAGGTMTALRQGFRPPGG